MTDKNEPERAREAQSARDRAEAAYEAARFDGLCEEGAAEVAADAFRASHSDAGDASQAGHE